MIEWATCPGGATGPCGKTVKITAAGTFANHRRGPLATPPGRGNCSIGILDRVRIADRIHPCVDCAALPVGPGVLVDVGGVKPYGPNGPEFRPPRPRAATGRPPRCHRHGQLHQKALRAARNARSRERSRGFAEEDRELLWAEQGERCGICHVPLKVEKKAPELDHDHDRAAEHDHPDDQVCRACARGLLCRTCNLHVVGRMDSAALLRAVTWSSDNPAVRLGWWSTDDEGAGDDDD